MRVFLTGAAPVVRTALSIAGARPPHVEYRPTIEEAVRDAHALVARMSYAQGSATFGQNGVLRLV